MELCSHGIDRVRGAVELMGCATELVETLPCWAMFYVSFLTRFVNGVNTCFILLPCYRSKRVQVGGLPSLDVDQGERGTQTCTVQQLIN